MLIVFSSVSECGNKLTRDKEAINNITSWPTFAVAISDNSSVRCYATICKSNWKIIQPKQ